MIVAVLPLAADAADPVANDLARLIAARAAAELARHVETRLVADAVPREAFAEAAAQLGAGAAVGGALTLESEAVALELALVVPSGEERAAWSEACALGAAPLLLGLRIARAVLLALGEDAPPELVAPDLAPDEVLRLARGYALLEDEGDASGLIALGTPLSRELVVAAAGAALQTDRTPHMLAALEALHEAAPDDFEVLVALADYRAAHFDAAGARALLLGARERAPGAAEEAAVLSRLAALAEAERPDEAVLLLRAAVRLVDDAQLYGRLGALLLSRDPGEAAAMLTRATVLAPDDGALLRLLARSLVESGADPRRIAEVERRALAAS